MKIVTLNTWGGRAGKEGLLGFFERSRQAVDVFCLQEIWRAPYDNLEGTPAGGLKIQHGTIMTNGEQEIRHALPEHQARFHPSLFEDYGLLTLVKGNFPLRDSGDIFVHEHKDFVPVGDVGYHARNLQHVTIGHHGRPLTILNFHGLWNGLGKTDSDARLTQSRNIIAFLRTLPGEYVLCGDFNLLPDTQSIRLLEEAGARNLIKEYGITSTRTSLYKKDETYADYVFVSPSVHVTGFRVLPDEVSDHAPLELTIE